MKNKAPDERTNVRKAVIVPYKKKDFQQQDQQAGNFVIPVNPETYSENLKVEYDKRAGHGDEGTDPRYKSTAPSELKMDFVLDGTGTIEGYYYAKKSVQEQIQQLKRTVYSKKSDKHRPNFCIVYWDALTFPCVMTSLDIKYTLFDEDGKPLRARVSLSFTEYISKKEREARANENSPDLTHIRQVKAGDRLDLMVYQIYDDSNLFLQVAKANGLASLRQLKVGSEVFFPPLDKTEV